MDKELLKSFAKRIKSLRHKYGYTQDDLAFKSEIARSTLGNIETASNDITLTKANKIAQGFDLTLSELLDFKN